jgi:hypothetical protein
MSPPLPLLLVAHSRINEMATKQPKPNGTGDTLLQETPAKTKPPSMWQVVMYNDDYTPMEFVIPDHAQSTYRGAGHLWRLPAGRWRDESGAGGGLRKAASASPALWNGRSLKGIYRVYPMIG